MSLIWKWKNIYYNYKKQKKKGGSKMKVTTSHWRHRPWHEHFWTPCPRRCFLSICWCQPSRFVKRTKRTHKKSRRSMIFWNHREPKNRQDSLQMRGSCFFCETRKIRWFAQNVSRKTVNNIVFTIPLCLYIDKIYSK